MTHFASAARHYFSNGTTGQMWFANWCERCSHDHHENHGPHGVVGPGCWHIASLYAGLHDSVFVDDPSGSQERLHCIAFSRCQCDRGPDDPGVEPPPPIDPNQGLLFEVTTQMTGVTRGAVLDAWAEIPVVIR